MYSGNFKRIIFGIDLDDTITKDPELFKELISIIRGYGHEVYIVTARHHGYHCDVSKEFEPLVDGIIFCGTKAKMDIADIDIWIDDFPLAITHDFKETRWVPGKTITEEKMV